MNAPPSGQSASFPAKRERLLAWVSIALLAASLFLLVLGGKLTMLNRYGTDVPNWDQWDAEGAYLLLPYLRGDLSLPVLFRPHNDHRVVCTKLLALGLFILNGQWDSRLECVTNALLHASLAVAMFLFGRRLVSRRSGLLWFLAVTAGAAFPFAWQNVLGGFHSQQILLIGLSVGAIALLLSAKEWTPRWWLGIACSVLALFTMGSGLLAAVVVILVLAAEPPVRTAWRRHGATLAACAIVFAIGWSFRVVIDHRDPIQSSLVSDFIITLWRSLQWPAVWFPPLALLVWLPWGWLSWVQLRRPASVEPGGRIVFAVGLWVLAQFAATAYARGGGGQWPSSRYFDTVVIGLLVNALGLLSTPAPAGVLGRLPWRRALVFLWAFVVVLGARQHISHVLNEELPAEGQKLQLRAEHARDYIVTGDVNKLSGEIPYPERSTLISRLSHGEIRSILPAGVRHPLPLSGGAGVGASFVRGGIPPSVPPPGPYQVFGSFSAEGAAARGEWRSAPFVTATAGYWVIPTAGGIGRPGLSLELVSAGSGEVLATIVPERLPGNGWRNAYVRAPSIPAVLLAHDSSTSEWMAFGAPVEIATGSFWALWLVHMNQWLLTAGSACLVAGLGFGWLSAMRRHPPV